MKLNMAEKLFILLWDKRALAIPHLARLGLGETLKIALIEDLRLKEKISIEPMQVTVLDNEPTGDALLDDMLATLKAKRSPFDPSQMMRKVAAVLVDDGIFSRAGDGSIAGDKLVLQEPDVRRDIVFQLHAFVSGTDGNNRESPVLIALLHRRNALLCAFPLVSHVPAIKREARILTKQEIELAISCSTVIGRMRLADPAIASSWASALDAFSKGQHDAFLLNAFPVFEKSIKLLYTHKVGGEVTDMRKCINALHQKRYLTQPIDRLHWVWTLRNDKVHQGTSTSPRDVEKIKALVESVVDTCFISN